jgi:ribose transport system permease protein
MVEMNAIATGVLGGRDPGRRTRIAGTFFAGILMGVVKNGLVLAGISSYYQQFVTGVIILAAIVVSDRSEKSGSEKRKGSFGR